MIATRPVERLAVVALRRPRRWHEPMHVLLVEGWAR